MHFNTNFVSLEVNWAPMLKTSSLDTYCASKG